MNGEVTVAQIASLLTALRMKGESVDEITGCSRVMRQKAAPVVINNKSVVDTCGTGGDGLSTFNISTTAAFVAAGAGVVIAKHGNRSISSCCGSADLIESLGINIQLNSTEVEKCIDAIGIGFLFAPLFHVSMRHAVEPRRQLGFRTLFNLLGPLVNPAGISRQVIGVYAPSLTEIVGAVLNNLGAEHVLVVHGMDGMDEITISAETKVTEVMNGTLSSYYLDPEDFGIRRNSLETVRGGTAAENAAITLAVLNRADGPHREIVLLNAAAALVVGGMAENMQEGYSLAARAIDSGAAYQKYLDLAHLADSLQNNYGGA